jgi:hypothetical protein
MNKTSNLIVILIFITLVNSKSWSQISIGGIPPSFSLDEKAEYVPVYTTPHLDYSTIRKEEATNGINARLYRYGVPNEVELNTLNSGIWRDLDNVDKVWQLKINCPEALSINLIFKQFHLINGATMYIYNVDKTHIIGGFNNRNNKGTLDTPKSFGTGQVYGENIIVELFVPKNIEKNYGILSIGTIVHCYRTFGNNQNNAKTASFGQSGNCQVNVNCPDGTDWQDIKTGVALVKNHLGQTSTGALVNNVQNDGKLYFLTANHSLAGLDASGN